MCGIYGQVSNRVENINSDKIKILGILNEERGTHSCGVTVDADIYQGVEVSNRKFRDFAISADFTPTTLPIVFGHNRKSSVGAINVHNAHPFGFGDNIINEGYEFIGAHNGTIYNYEDLAETYDVAEKVTTEGSLRTKIDSEILLESIYKSKSFKPLSNYVGGAALIWYTPDNGKFYMFSGESKSYPTSAVTEIERPLHVWVVDDNNFYFSSEDTPLLVLGAQKEDVFQIETNTVYVITNGDFKNAEKYRISRNNVTNKKPYANNVGTHSAYNRLPTQETSAFNHRSRHNYLPVKEGAETSKEGTNASGQNCSARKQEIEGITKPKKLVHAVTTTMITNRPPVQIETSDYRGRVYVRAMRYYRNGHPLTTGVYIYIPKHGLYNVGSVHEEAVNYCEKNRNNFFDIVSQCIITKPLTIEERQSPRYTRLSSSAGKNDEFTLYYIVGGYIMKEYFDYAHYINNPQIYFSSDNTPNYHTLSHVTRYPVYCETGADRHKFLTDGLTTPGGTFIAGPCCEYTIKINDAGSVYSVSMMNRVHLTGVELQNELEYEEKVAKAEAETKAKKEAEEKAKKESVITVEEATSRGEGFSVTTDSLRALLISWVNVEPVCFESSDTIDIVSLMAERVIIAFDEYEEDMIQLKYDTPAQDVFVQYCIDSVKLMGVTDFEEYVFDIVGLFVEQKTELINKNLPKDKPQINKLTKIIGMLFQN